MLEFWLRYDLRSPAVFGRGSAELARAAIEQVEWADKRGFHRVELTEHHGTPDNVNPSPLIMAAAMASRTSTIRFQPSAIILPLHDPIRIAEDCIMVDIVSNGRLDVTLGLGYMPAEFAMFGISLKDRARIMDSKLEALGHALKRESFEYEGRKIRVTPCPAQDGGPALFIGGGVRAAAHRAARFGDGYYPMTYRDDYVAEYRRVCAELGKAPGRVINGNGVTVIHIAEDPEQAWAELAPYALYENNAYAANAASAGQALHQQSTESTEALRASGNYLVLTPDEGLSYCRERHDLGRHIVINPLICGVDPEFSWKSLELIASRIIPELAAQESPLDGHGGLANGYR
ncbi:LLM class flavin-dependent oxidoreductase [Sphingobium tyrosinilyticum]|uniref:LLM class flavin-dependent oxidoreductase n=1 Tax=Sphingobium tyrosinilyticum TaxID=2715436 RepID=A0ABV9F2N4_9SPHN